MIFSAVSSSSVSQFIKNRNAENFQDEFSETSRAMKKQYYVDDYLDSCCIEKGAIQIVKGKFMPIDRLDLKW